MTLLPPGEFINAAAPRGDARSVQLKLQESLWRTTVRAEAGARPDRGRAQLLCLTQGQ